MATAVAVMSLGVALAQAFMSYEGKQAVDLAVGAPVVWINTIVDAVGTGYDRATKNAVINWLLKYQGLSFPVIGLLVSFVVLNRFGGAGGQKLALDFAGGISHVGTKIGTLVEELVKLLLMLVSRGGVKILDIPLYLYKIVGGTFTSVKALIAKLRRKSVTAQNKIENKIETLSNSKAKTPAKSPGRLKLEQEMAELKMMLQQLKNQKIQTPVVLPPTTPSPVRPKTPSPNYIYVGGRKIPLRRKPMSPAKAKEGRLRKVVRRVLHGRTEEEKMMKLAKALRKRALAASARSRAASAARSRTAKN
jgi:hypothetical protein